MGSLLAVDRDPRRTDATVLIEARELAGPRHFDPERSVESLDASAPPETPRLNDVPADVPHFPPDLHGVASERLPAIAADRNRDALPRAQRLQRVNHAVGAQADVDLASQGIPRVVVENMEAAPGPAATPMKSRNKH